MSVKRKTAKLKPKLLYRIDNCIYTSKTLYDFHLLCDEAQKDKLIKSFEIPHDMGKKSRYSTYKPIIDDIKFDSLMEARYYLYLLRLKNEKKIKSFERQVIFELQPKFKKNGKTFRPITYICDFLVVNNDNIKEVIDTKGKETPEFKIKRKLFEYCYPDLNLRTIQYDAKSDQWLDTDTLRKQRKNQHSAKKSG